MSHDKKKPASLKVASKATPQKTDASSDKPGRPLAAAAKNKPKAAVKHMKSKTAPRKETSAAKKETLASPRLKKEVKTPPAAKAPPTPLAVKAAPALKRIPPALSVKSVPAAKPVSHRPGHATPSAPPASAEPLRAPAPSQKTEIKPEPVAKAPPAPPPAPRVKISVPETVTVKELAEKMGAKLPDVMKKLITLGVMANLNQRLDANTVARVAEAFNFDVEIVLLYADEALNTPDDLAELKPRPPVVTVMGHVDHGKTSLLDAIRSARVAEKEAGGITQHIGAYQVKTERGLVTFLDTPGHEAFTAMRARGAQATDLVILVVGADDGVMPQTVEALNHARAAGVPIVVAINKCDLPTANPQRIKQELANLELVAEDWGGKTVMVEVSAKQKTNLDKLLEMILIEAELLELKANPNRPAQGVVVEAKLDPRRGPVATVLIQKGTLRIGDSFVCGVTAGRIRALTNDQGERVKEAPPAYPVEIMGLSGTPQAGDKLVAVATDREAREIAERRQIIASDDARRTRPHLTLEAFHEEAAAGKVKNLPIVLKADVQGSLEAIRDSLEKLSTGEIAVRIIHAGIGGITNSDVVLAHASDAVILGFNVRPDPMSESLALREGVEFKTYRIIYDMINEVKAGLEGLLDPEEKEVTTGWAEVRKTFTAPKVGFVAGCMVTDGKVSRTGKARLVRNGVVVFEGAIASLRRFKDDVKDVDKGYECGIALANFQDIKVGDRFEFYLIEKHARKL